MIKFFRKIRQRLLAENKFSTYLIYAVGEIILVVIGILIALQINNWNEQNKIKQEEDILLDGLIQNIEKDIKNLTRLKQQDSIFIDANKIVLSAFKNDSIRNNKPLLVQKSAQASFISSFTPTQIIFNQMQFSGKLNYILNDSIKNNIQSYYDNIANVMNSQESNLNFIYDLNFELIKYSDANSALQSILPDYAKMELEEIDNSFFYEPIQSDKVKEFANMTTAKQAVMLSIYFAHSNLLQEGIELRQSLIEYRNEK